MKKIMFNDKYGLTEAVLKGRKTSIEGYGSGDVTHWMPIPGLKGGEK